MLALVLSFGAASFAAESDLPVRVKGTNEMGVVYYLDPGEEKALEVETSGEGYTFQWYRGWIAGDGWGNFTFPCTENDIISGATDSSLIVKGSSDYSAQPYCCLVISSNGERYRVLFYVYTNSGFNVEADTGIYKSSYDKFMIQIKEYDYFLKEKNESVTLSVTATSDKTSDFQYSWWEYHDIYNVYDHISVDTKDITIENAEPGKIYACRVTDEFNNICMVHFNIIGDEYYDLWVAGTQVTSSNLNDVLSDGGKVKYDPENSTLILNDPQFSLNGTAQFGGVIEVQNMDLAITGNAKITASDIQGAKAGIVAKGENNRLDIKADLTITGVESGIEADGTVNFSGGTVTINGGTLYGVKAKYIAVSGGLVHVKSLTYGLYAPEYIIIYRGDVQAFGSCAGICTDGLAIPNENGFISFEAGTDVENGSYPYPSAVRCSRGITIGNFPFPIEYIIPENGSVKQMSLYEGAEEQYYVFADSEGKIATHVLLRNRDASVNVATDNGSSLSLKDKISVNIYAGIPEDAEGWTAELYYEKDGFTKAVRTYNLDKTSANGYQSKTKEYKFVYSDISAKEMTEKVRVKFFDMRGIPVFVKAKDGTYKEYIDFCAADWANTMINDPTRPVTTVNLAKALLNYGGEAQNYWNYKPEANANQAGYLASDMAAVTASNLEAFAPVKDANTSAVGENGISLSLKSETYLNVYFTKEVSVSAADLNGAKVAVSRSGEEWVAKITGITAKNLGNQYTLTVKNGSTTSTQKYCALSWAYNILKGTSEKAKPLAKALYLYQQAAVEYFK